MDADAPVDDVDSRFAVRGGAPPAHNAPEILDSLLLPTAPIGTTTANGDSSHILSLTFGIMALS